MVLTHGDVREYLVDRGPADNDLLEDIDFSDGQIKLAIRLACAEFNDLTPLTLAVTPDTIPLAAWSLEAVQEQLYQIRLNQLERNHFELQAGNTGFDSDGARIANLRAALQRLGRWRETAVKLKRRQDAANTWGCA